MKTLNKGALRASGMVKCIPVPGGWYTPNSMETEAPTLDFLLDLVPLHLAIYLYHFYYLLL